MQLLVRMTSNCTGLRGGPGGRYGAAMAEPDTPADQPAEQAAPGSRAVKKKAGLAGAALATLWLLGVLFRRRRS